jgi:hypothetical protein
VIGFGGARVVLAVGCGGASARPTAHSSNLAPNQNQPTSSPPPRPHSTQDEVLAHRLGLVPLNVDPDLLEFKGPEDAAGERNTVVLRLRARCARGPKGEMVGDQGEIHDS